MLIRCTCHCVSVDIYFRCILSSFVSPGIKSSQGAFPSDELELDES